MRDIQMVLERWGAWAANNHEDVTWSSIAAGFKGLIPSKVRSRPQCCDEPPRESWRLNFLRKR